MNDSNNPMDSFATRIGFILVSAGCAIGIGNVWKFPYSLRPVWRCRIYPHLSFFSC